MSITEAEPTTLFPWPVHPAADMFPMLNDDELDELAADIEESGLLEPVWLTVDGELLDGRNRVVACQRAGVDVLTKTYDGDDPIGFVVALNLHRRHLTAGQRAAVAYDLLPMIEAQNPVGRPPVDEAKNEDNRPQLSDGERAPQTRDVAGELAGTSGKSVSRYKRLAENTPDLAEKVRDGELSLNAAEEELKSRLYPGESDAVEENLHNAGIDVDEDTVADGEAEAVGSRNLPALNPISKPDLDGTGLSHPARYTESILPTFHDILLEVTGRVLDPFAGTGRIHQCARLNLETVGVEIEPEWANLHPDTIIGDALDLPFPDGSFNAIVTSPTYGNRLSDSYNAADPEKRRSYRFDLGRELHPNNSGQLKWGPDYRAFHQQAWSEAERVLAPGGLFVLNITDFAIKDVPQPVAAWHVATLVALGLTYDPELSCGVHTPGLRQGTNARRIEGEFVLVFRKDPF